MTPDAPSIPTRSAEPHARDVELCRRVASGDGDAMREFYAKYNRLIRYLCIRLVNRVPKAAAVEEADVIQLGWELALEQARIYKGAIPFANWLPQYFELKLRLKIDDQMYGVRLPTNVIWSVLRLESVNTARRFSRRPFLTDAEVDQQFDTPVAQLRRAEFAQTYLRKHLGSIDHGLSSHQDDAPSDVYDINGYVHFTPVIGAEPPSVEAQVEASALAALLREALEKYLTDEERTILVLRFGLNGDELMVLRKIDEVLGRKSGYASRIHKIALAKLAHPATGLRGLHHFLG